MPVLQIVIQKEGELSLSDLPNIAKRAGVEQGDIVVIFTLDEALELLKSKKEGGKE